MPTCQSERSVFIAFFSRTGVLGQAIQSPSSHPFFAFCFAKQQVEVESDKLQKPRFPAISGCFRPRGRPWNSPPGWLTAGPDRV